MTFRIHALPMTPFAPFFAMTEEERRAGNARLLVADAAPGYPCRVSLQDANVGETVLLVNHTHTADNTPYRASHAVFVREAALQAKPEPGQTPSMFAHRLLSLRAFNAEHMMTRADVVSGGHLADALNEMLADRAITHVDIHNAKPGCFAARATRA